MTKRNVTKAEVTPLYTSLPEKYRLARERFGRPLTLAEKILSSHLDRWNEGEKHPVRGKSQVFLRPDRVALQDATAQMALLQFMTAGLPEVAAPSTVHCDHLIQAKSEGRIDRRNAVETNAEVEVTMDAGAIEAYLARVTGLVQELRATARRLNGRYVRVLTDEPLEAPIRRLVLGTND